MENGIARKRIGIAFLDDESGKPPITLSRLLTKDGIPANEIRLVETDEPREPRIENSVLDPDVDAPGVVAFLEAHGIQGIGPEIRQSEFFAGLPKGVVDDLHILGSEMQLPAQLAYIG